MEENEPLDETSENENIQSDIPIFPFIRKFGLIGSGILMLFTIVSYSVNGIASNSEFSTAIISIVLSNLVCFLAYVGIMTWAIMEYKESNEGYASLGKAFLVTFLTGLFMAVVFMIFTIIITSVLEMNLFGLGDNSDLQNSFEVMGLFMTIFSSLFSLITNSIGGAVIALIISASIKKERPLGSNSF